jgi:hypothetical protein
LKNAGELFNAPVLGCRAQAQDSGVLFLKNKDENGRNKKKPEILRNITQHQ